MQHIKIHDDPEWKTAHMTPEFYRRGLEHIEQTSGTSEERLARKAYFQFMARRLMTIHTKKLAGERASE